MTPPDRPAVRITLGGAVPAADLPPEVEPLPSAPPRRRWTGRRVAVALVGAAALLVSGTGLAVAVGLSGGGTQPADVLPADALALLQVDFDPSAEQKLAAWHLARRFDDVGVRTQTSLKDDLVGGFVADATSLDYDDDLAPWIGDRAGLALLPDRTGDGLPDVVVAVAVADREEAEDALPRVAAGAGGGLTSWAFTDDGDYVVLAQEPGTADDAASAEDVLADDPRWADAVGALEGDQVATGWVDLGATWDALPGGVRDAVSEGYGGELVPAGRYVAGVHLDRAHLELTGRGFGLSLGPDVPVEGVLGTGAPTRLAAEMPSASAVAGSIGGFGAYLQSLLMTYAAVPGATEGLDDIAAELGLSLEQDLPAVLGDDLGFAVLDVSGSPEVGLRTRGGDVDRGLDVAQRLLDLASESDEESLEDCLAFYDELAADPSYGVAPGEAEEACEGLPLRADLPRSQAPGTVDRVDDGLVFGTTTDALEQVSGDGGLGSTGAFRDAVPDADGASTVVFVDLDRLLAQLDEDDEQVAPLRAVGFSVGPGLDGAFRLRLTLD